MEKLQALLLELQSNMTKAQETALRASFDVKKIQAQIKKVEKLIEDFK